MMRRDPQVSEQASRADLLDGPENPFRRFTVVPAEQQHISSFDTEGLQALLDASADQRRKPCVALHDDDEIVPITRSQLGNRLRHTLRAHGTPKEVVHAAVERTKAALARNTERRPQTQSAHAKACTAERDRRGKVETIAHCTRSGESSALRRIEGNRLTLGRPNTSISVRTTRKNRRAGARMRRLNPPCGGREFGRGDMSYCRGEEDTRPWTSHVAQSSAEMTTSARRLDQRVAHVIANGPDHQTNPQDKRYTKLNVIAMRLLVLLGCMLA